MLFISPFYILFLLWSVVFYWWAVPVRWRTFSLIIISFFLLLFNSVLYTIVLCCLTVGVYFIGRTIVHEKQLRKKYLLFIPSLIIIFLFCYFKYWDELKVIAEKLFKPGDEAGFNFKKPVFSLGISYFTLKFLHYLFDSARGKCKNVRLRDYILYMLFFPIYTSGPIERIQKFTSQVNKERDRFRIKNFVIGVDRIIIGIFKKIVIADIIAPYTAVVFMAPQDYSSLRLWITIYLYSIQIYTDFSGYTDIAIGSSKLFGYDISENFKRPYLKPNIALFWQSWHITLSNWLRDYIFLPLAKRLMAMKTEHKVWDCGRNELPDNHDDMRFMA